MVQMPSAVIMVNSVSTIIVDYLFNPGQLILNTLKIADSVRDIMVRPNFISKHNQISCLLPFIGLS